MLAVVCPGQGSQKPGFLAEWLRLDGVPEHLERLSAAAGLDLAWYGIEADEAAIKDTAVAQPLIVAAGLLAVLVATLVPRLRSSRAQGRARVRTDSGDAAGAR